MFLLKIELRVKYIIAVVLLSILLLVATILLICLSEKSDTGLRNKQAKNKTDDSQEITAETETPIEVGNRTDENVTTEQTTTLQIEHGTEEINITEIWSTTEETLTSFETNTQTDEDEYFTKKPMTPLEARKAYYAVHGRSVSENKCMEFERNRCDYMEEHQTRLVEIFKRPLVHGRNRFGNDHRDIAIASNPHMGALGWLDTSNNWFFFCSGSLINPNFILTAAHCAWLSPKKYNIVDPKPRIVRLGNENILERDPNDYSDVDIQEIIVHPAYKSPFKYSDIALIKLNENVEYNSHIAPACLTRQPNVDIGDDVFVVGWRHTRTTTAETDETSWLETADVILLNSNVCEDMFKVVQDTNYKGVRSHQLCAGISKEDVDTCKDEATRFIQVPDARVCLLSTPLLTLIGVTSFGFGCTRATSPSIYTSVHLCRLDRRKCMERRT